MEDAGFFGIETEHLNSVVLLQIALICNMQLQVSGTLVVDDYFCNVFHPS